MEFRENIHCFLALRGGFIDILGFSHISKVNPPLQHSNHRGQDTTALGKRICERER